MSRTIRGNKSVGHDMWGNRPCAGQSNDMKRTCRKIERANSRKLTRIELDLVGEEDATMDPTLWEVYRRLDSQDIKYYDDVAAYWREWQ